MINRLKMFYEKTTMKWLLNTSYYFVILLLLFLIYGFHTANTGSYIYNDF
ncbi:teichoic acid D-Ala incorporation-associated protein DltX [Bacillus sp. CLL-7-23]|uniref:Teichoic acid D-Ala incorporation-associated protein DltX n=1 Tax=Bacillus changyiensis TaxID=3004103 RepID=A0ABT4WZB8_9BACI|nr:MULTISPECIES: teichoic acid D-Ala incorporation-associated protein DltX [Bacillus]MDA7025270.1 teichoic acid D-Ala incorporation-associated protein DltX [Bacillus changyiensis]NPC94578.1 teichoic acid D-Ala incorporation-associated protein DltX [Bacillus sp. WMMC1349]